MKKLILLALVALVAGAAFADSEPAFSGTFDLYWNVNFDAESAYAEMIENSGATIAFNGVVDEWTTINAEFGSGYAQEDSAGAGSEATVTVNDFTLTTDVTGALGVDGPVSLTIIMGEYDFEPASYGEVAGKNFVGFGNDTEDHTGLVLKIGIMEMVNLNTFIMPTTYSDWFGAGAREAGDAAIAVELQLMAIENLMFNVYYTKDDNFDAPADFVNEMGVTASYDLGIVKFGVGFQYGLDSEVSKAGLSVKSSPIEKLTLGASFGVGDFQDFGPTAGFTADLSYALTDGLTVFTAVSVSNFEDILFKMDAGLAAKLGSTTYTIGYDLNDLAWKSDGDINDEGLYLRVVAEF